MLKAERMDWIDAAKGIGILLVVYGHIYSGPIKDFIFMFHMPLFFFIGGMLLKNSNNKNYTKEKARQLLIPYASYLVSISALYVLVQSVSKGFSIEQLLAVAQNAAIGGRALSGFFGVFWFVTCFFFAQQIAKKLIATDSTVTIMACAAACLLVGMAVPLISPGFWLPLNINVTPVAVFFFLAGYLYKKELHHTLVNHCRPAMISSALLLMAALYFCGAKNLAMDMKAAHYGIPVVSVAASLLAISILLLFCTYLQKTPPLKKLLALFGSASMTVMFTHQIVHLSLIKRFDITWVFFLSAFVPLLIHVAISKTKLTQILFLGVARQSTPPNTFAPHSGRL